MATIEGETDAQAATATAALQAAGVAAPASLWTPPTELHGRLVLPDLYTAPGAVADTLGKDSDPTRMGIFICLLDDRPHLHPSLHALHAHRLRAHDLASPPDPVHDLPLGQGTEWTGWKLTDEEEARRAAYLPHA